MEVDFIIFIVEGDGLWPIIIFFATLDNLFTPLFALAIIFPCNNLVCSLLMQQAFSLLYVHHTPLELTSLVICKIICNSLLPTSTYILLRTVRHIIACGC